MSDVTFRIIEEDNRLEIDEYINRLISEGKEHISCRKIKRHCGCSIKQAKDSLLRILDEKGLDRKEYSNFDDEGNFVQGNVKGNPRYYYKLNESYEIAKNNVKYGRVKTEKEAQMVVEELKKVDWDKSHLPVIKEKLGIVNSARVYGKYYYRTPHDTFVVQRGLNYYGSYKTEEEAQKLVVELKKVNWDKQELPHIIEKLGINKGWENSKNYYRASNGKFKVSKTINGEWIYAGYYETEEQAQMMVDELNKCGWDKSQLNTIKEKLGEF